MKIPSLCIVSVASLFTVFTMASPHWIKTEKKREVARNASGCGELMYKCGDGECIPSHWRCDRDYDCEDGTDETDNCPSRCPDNEFECWAAGKPCVPREWVCDTGTDCENQLDEQDCPTDCSGENQFRCGETGQCIPLWYRCDGEVDCASGTADEEGCDEFDCGPNRFRCGSKCQIKPYLCNGQTDCPSGVDEDPEVCRKYGVNPP